MSSTLPGLPAWPAGKPLPARGITILHDPDTGLEYNLDLSRLGGDTPYHVGTYTARASGAQTITSTELSGLDTAALVVSVGVRGLDAQGKPMLDPLPSNTYGLVAGALSITAEADVDKDDVLEVHYITAGQLTAVGLSAAQLASLLVAGDGVTITPTPEGKLLISATTVAAVPKAPVAPTAGQVDDTADTFSFLPNPAYPASAQYKVVGRPGTTGAEQLDATNSYVGGNRIYIKVVGAVAKSGLAVYVAGSGSVPDGQPLTNAEPFTGAVVVTPPATNTPPNVSASAQVTGTSVKLTGLATDADGIDSIFLKVFDSLGAAVQTFGPSVPGDTSFVTTWASGSAGTYTVRAIATDSKGLPATSDAASFTVSAAGADKGYQSTYTDTIPADA